MTDDIFERAKARADDAAPAPADRPVAAALTAFGFGLFVVGLYIAMQWLGLRDGMAWAGAAAGYAAIAYGDCHIGWQRHRREYHEALADLKEQSPPRSVH